MSIYALRFSPQHVRDVWYEAGTVWYVHKDGFTLGESENQRKGLFFPWVLVSYELVS